MRHIEIKGEERSALYRYLLYILTVMPLFTVNLIYLLSVTSTQDSQVAKNDTKKRFYGAMFASLACNNRIFVRINFHEKNL